MFISSSKISNFPWCGYTKVLFIKKIIKKKKLIKSNPNSQFKHNIIINLVWDFNLLENLKKG